MPDSAPSVRVTLRIPGMWKGPAELLDRLPRGVKSTPETITLADGSVVDFDPMPSDEQFAGIFASSCRRAPTPEECNVVENYAVNILLSGAGGSLDAARTMMRVGAAIVEAGGAGVFIDNSGLAHGGEAWREMADDGGTDALTFAFVSIVSGETEVWTMGMHVLGLPEFMMRKTDLSEDGSELIEVMRYACDGGKPIGPGHIIVDLDGPRFQAVAAKSDRFDAGTPMHNPFGRLKLVSVKDIAEGN